MDHDATPHPPPPVQALGFGTGPHRVDPRRFPAFPNTSRRKTRESLLLCFFLTSFSTLGAGGWCRRRSGTRGARLGARPRRSPSPGLPRR